MNNIVGIDLGTTMSAIALLNSVGKPEIIPNKEGERLTPSFLYFESGNKIRVGGIAKNYSGQEPDNVAKEFKRQMHNSAFRLTIGGNEYSPSMLSSHVLKKMVQDASMQIGDIRDVVISVPAYFKEQERNATIEAGRLAGLNVTAIINEPTAAALYYASSNNVTGKGIIYDLGGGTFDVTVTETDGKDVKIITSVGDHHLGGVDFDIAILELLQEKYRQETASELFKENDQGSRNEFLIEAEEVKKDLSARSSSRKRIAGEGGKATIEITRQEFEEKISTLISRTELLVEQALDEADIEESDLAYVLLVGGSTRVPLVQGSVKKLLGLEPLNAVNVDEAVALGAAIKAGLVAVQSNPTQVSSSIAQEMNSINLGEVTNASYGTISVGIDEHTQLPVLKNTIIIKKNTPIPCEKTDTFFTMSEGQDELNFKLTQGEDTDPDFVNIVMEKNMLLPSGRADSQPIEVTYKYDENQIMTCIVRDVNSGEVKTFTAELGSNNESNSAIDAFLVE